MIQFNKDPAEETAVFKVILVILEILGSSKYLDFTSKFSFKIILWDLKFFSPISCCPKLDFIKHR